MQTPHICRDYVAVGVCGPRRKVFEDGSPVSNFVCAKHSNDGEKANDVIPSVDPNMELITAFANLSMPAKLRCDPKA